MRPSHRSMPAGGAFSRRFSSYCGLFFDEFDLSSAWVRERAVVRLPLLEGTRTLVLSGEFRIHPDARGMETAPPGLRIAVNGRDVARLAPGAPGSWEIQLARPEADEATLELTLTGTRLTNLLAWLGRVTGFGPWQRFRAQRKNRQLRVTRIATETGETIFDFSRRDAPYSADYARRHVKLGMNIVGFLAADLGVGESARCMVRAADAVGIPAALVPLKLHCKNRLGDQAYAGRLQDENPHAVNVIHVDPPASRDIDHHHGKAFRAGKYNIGYFAWELPEFPDAWVASLDYYDEIWCPSDFTSGAIAVKSPVPVLTMPHAIGFPLPGSGMGILPMSGETPANTGGTPVPLPIPELRARFRLPGEVFLFLTLFDLNSYSARKNPRAAIDAFRRSGLAGQGAALVLKVQNVSGNEADFAALQSSVEDLAGTVLITDTLSRADVYALESACDVFVSLHRSEGFGLAVAESMYLGKPVIATDWSATAEYVTPENGCPVRARIVALEQNHGPYAKGSTWAEPDPAHAAEHMRKLFHDRALVEKLGAAARTTIQTRFAPAVIGARYRRRLESIATF